MSRRIGPRFGSGFEQLECREVPAVITFTVNTTNDTPWDPVNHPTDPLDANGNTSLRAVVDFANANPQLGNPVVNNYIVEIPLAGPITLDPNIGTMFLGSNFRFNGNDTTPQTTVQRSAAVAAFHLFELDSGTSVYFHSMTLQGGRNLAGNAGGGAIQVNDDAKVQVENCTLTNNSAVAFGGAIAAFLETEVWISNSTFGLNEAGDGGGAIYTNGATTLSIYSSWILENETTGAGKHGGGLYIQNTLSTLLDHTSITDNGATGSGGGLYFLDNSQATACTLMMSRGEFDGNTAGGDGGGLYMDAAGETVTLTNVSVTDNGAGGKGGGAYVFKGTLDGRLLALTGNSATGGIPGVAYKTGAFAPIIVPFGQQTVVLDP